MKLIITEAQAAYIINESGGKILNTVGQKLGDWGGKLKGKASEKAADVVTNVGPDVANWAMTQQTGGEKPIELSPEIAARFDDINIEKDAPNLHKFLQTLKNPTAAKGAAEIFKSPKLAKSIKGMIHPLGRGIKISSPFGERESPTEGASRSHSGVDLSVPSGTPIYAPLDGVVTRAENVPPPDGCGGHIRIKHNKRMDTKYCHVKKWKVSKGDKVKKGDLIGYTGGGKDDPYRGVSTGPHLHYAIVVDGKHVDPLTIQPNLA